MDAAPKKPRALGSPNSEISATGLAYEFDADTHSADCIEISDIAEMLSRPVGDAEPIRDKFAAIAKLAQAFLKSLEYDSLGNTNEAGDSRDEEDQFALRTFEFRFRASINTLGDLRKELAGMPGILFWLLKEIEKQPVLFAKVTHYLEALLSSKCLELIKKLLNTSAEQKSVETHEETCDPVTMKEPPVQDEAEKLKAQEGEWRASIKQMLAGMPREYQKSYERIVQLRHILHNEIAAFLQPQLQTYFNEGFQGPFRQRRTIGTTVNFQLRSIGLTTKFPGKEAPGTLLIGSNDKKGIATRVRFEGRDEHGEKIYTKSSTATPELALMESPMRIEQFAKQVSHSRQTRTDRTV